VQEVDGIGKLTVPCDMSSWGVLKCDSISHNICDLICFVLFVSLFASHMALHNHISFIENFQIYSVSFLGIFFHTGPIIYLQVGLLPLSSFPHCSDSTVPAFRCSDLQNVNVIDDFL